MFCKHCGKEIDDNSTFCKHCGKSLKEATTQSEMPFWEKKFLTYLLHFIIGVVVVAIWLYIASISTSGSNYSTIMNLFRVTVLIVFIVYLISRVSYKNRIILFNKSDSPEDKLKKYFYILYTLIIPFICMLIVDRLIREGSYEAKDIIMYFVLFAFLWIVPTVAICSRYDKTKQLNS